MRGFLQIDEAHCLEARANGVFTDARVWIFFRTMSSTNSAGRFRISKRRSEAQTAPSCCMPGESGSFPPYDPVRCASYVPIRTSIHSVERGIVKMALGERIVAVDKLGRVVFGGPGATWGAFAASSLSNRRDISVMRRMSPGGLRS